MSIKLFAKLRLRDSEELAFLRGRLLQILFWPFVCALLGALVWTMIDSKLAADKRMLERMAQKDASSVSKAYAHHLAHSLEQLDELIMQAKYHWENSGGHVQLDALKSRGLFAAKHLVSINIFDADGNVRTSTLALHRPMNLKGSEYFEYHRAADPAEIVIGPYAIGRISGKGVLKISRRLNDSKGEFAGIVVISVEPEFFSLFSNDPILGRSGMVALVGDDGGVRVSRVGDTVSRIDKPDLLAIPALGANEGPILLSGSHWFADGKARYVATQSLAPYPLSVLVGLSEEEILQPYEQSRALYRNATIAGGLILALFAAVSMYMSARLAWRRHLAESARSAYRLATEGGNEAYLMCRPVRGRDGAVIDLEIVDCNERALLMLGTARDRLTHAKVSDFYSGAAFERLLDVFGKTMETGFYEDEHEVKTDRIQARWLHRRLVRAQGGIALTLRDITDQKNHERELTRLATQDMLTGLPNRHWLMQYLPKALERASADGTQVAILFIDLDDFKYVNDSSGHTAGDQLLQAIAARLKLALRPADHVVRLGGDEFTVILEAIASEQEVPAIAQRIMDTCRSSFELLPMKSMFGASIGISMFPRDGLDAETLLKNADIAMYAAKASQKGKFRFYDRELYEQIKVRLDTERELQRAIEQDHFVIHYQPRVNAKSGELAGMEALVRWMHPQRGMVFPNEFIPLAESTGMIVELGTLMMDKVCAQIAAWRQQRLPVVPVSVNVSAGQFNRGGVHHALSASLAAHGVPGSLVEIELTESAMTGDFDHVLAEITALNALGIKCHVDDFGTGYSSLSLLHRLDMDVLKVDRAFTSQIGNGKEGEIFFSAIVSMARALGMSVIAEGVETEEQLRILQKIACDEIQGYLISRPLPAQEIPPLLHRRFLYPVQLVED